MKRKGLTVISMLLAAILILGCASSGGRIHSEAGGGTLKDMAGQIKNFSKKTALTKSYGVFPGLERKDKNRLKGYKTVVIDAEYFTSADIARMHKSGQKVYSYLNVGSLETYRSYYKKFKSITIGRYENWPDEYWIDVSKASWQKYVVNTLAKKLVQKRGLSIYLTEYAKKGSRLEKDVAKYCKSKKYQYYVSHNIQLNGL